MIQKVEHISQEPTGYNQYQIGLYTVKDLKMKKFFTYLACKF